MRYGIIWYVGVGEHDYEESHRTEYTDVPDLFDGLRQGVCPRYGDDMLFAALDNGRQDSVYWVTDDFGFALHRP